MKQYTKVINGETVFFDGILKTSDKQIINPTEEQLVADGWVEYTPPTPPTYTPTYGELVAEKIRERYTENDELALLRQRFDEDKTAEFEEYYNYCEQCKAAARAELEI